MYSNDENMANKGHPHYRDEKTDISFTRVSKFSKTWVFWTLYLATYQKSCDQNTADPRWKGVTERCPSCPTFCPVGRVIPNNSAHFSFSTLYIPFTTYSAPSLTHYPSSVAHREGISHSCPRLFLPCQLPGGGPLLLRVSALNFQVTLRELLASRSSEANAPNYSVFRGLTYYQCDSDSSQEGLSLLLFGCLLLPHWNVSTNNFLLCRIHSCCFHFYGYVYLDSVSWKCI